MKEFSKPSFGGNRGGDRGGSRGGFGGGNRGGFGGSRGGDRGGSRGGSFGPREMFSAKCDECGKTCELPFKPTGDKPVYCSNCFTAKGGNDRNDRGGDRGSRSFSKPSFNAGIRDNFKPTIDSGSNETLKNQIDAINKKIDNLTSLVAGLTNAKSVKPIKIETKAETKTETKKVVKKPTVKVATKKVAKKVAKKSNKK